MTNNGYQAWAQFGDELLMEIMIAFAFGMLGAFYMFGGYAVIRAIAMDTVIDTAIENIDFLEEGSEPANKDRLKKRFLGVMAAFSFAGGAFLFFQSALATALFCVCLAMQLLHIMVLGPRYFDRHEDHDPNDSGRQATINAMILYALVTFCLLYAQRLGVLPSFPPSWSQREFAGLIVTIAFAIYAYWQMRLPSSNHAPDPDISQSAQPRDIFNIAELRIQATTDEDGLWARSEATDFWETVEPDQLGISIALKLRISKWEDRYDRFCDAEELDVLNDEPNWSDPEKRTHFHEAHSIAQLLKDEVNLLNPDRIKITWVNQQGEILEI